jgi:glycosyltransferase involved in cell wall biosynthesis
MLGLDFCWKFVGKRDDNESWRFDQCVEFCKANNLEDNVTFLGSRDDVPQLLSQADLFVYASDHDTFGIAVIEAIAAGVPVMVNDWPVMNEITLNGKLATIYKTKSEESFYKCFSDFIENRGKYIEKAKIASEKVKELYSIDNHINELIERVYKPLMSKS